MPGLGLTFSKWYISVAVDLCNDWAVDLCSDGAVDLCNDGAVDLCNDGFSPGGAQPKTQQNSIFDTVTYFLFSRVSHGTIQPPYFSLFLSIYTEPDCFICNQNQFKIKMFVGKSDWNAKSSQIQE